MMKYSYLISAIIIIVSFLCSCSQDEIVGYQSSVNENCDATINIKINPLLKSRSLGLTDAEEKQFNNIQLFIFNSDGILVTTKFFPNVNINTDLTNIDTRSGSNMSVYIIANITPLSANFVSLYDDVTTIGDLNNLIAYTTGDDVEQDRLLLMEGSVNGVNIPEKEQGCAIVPITLNYVMSKIVVDIIDNTPDGISVDWSDWKILNFAKKSYIIPRAQDASVSPSDFLNSASVMDLVDSTYTLPGGELKDGKHATFYIFENRKGGRVAGSPSDTDPKNKNTYAPNLATAFQADGSYLEGSTNKGLRTTIYLGANAYDDYNVERGCIYKYTITVNSLDNIDVDSRIEELNSGFQAEILETTLDCHYDWRPIRLGAYGENLTIKVLDSSGNEVTDPNFWLKVSSINLNKFVDNGSGSFVRPTYNPATDMKLEIDNITVGSTSAKEFVYYFLYADQFDNIGGTRTAKISVSSDSGGAPIEYTITQKGYLVLGSNVGLRYIISDSNDGVDNNSDFRLAVENTEEATLVLTPGASVGSEMTSTMQFGFPNINIQPSNSLEFDYYKRNGFDISENLVLNNNNLRPPYGRISTTTISEEVHNPIFNSYGARYCFEKNRDIDGNGKIEGSEIQWYLPSIDELELLFVGNPYLAIPNTAYTSSTQFSTPNLTGIRLDLGRSGFANKSVPLYIRCVKKLAANNSQKSSPYVEPNSNIVNSEGFESSLLRTTNPSIPVPTHTDADALNQSFSKRFQVALVDIDNTVNWNSTGGQCEGYKQPGESQASKTWRAPTQRELYLIYLVHEELENTGVSGFQSFVQDAFYYWSSTEYSLGSSQAWAMSFRDGVMYNRTKSTKYYLRCIKDL